MSRSRYKWITVDYLNANMMFIPGESMRLIQQFIDTRRR
jgi:hypothetical protein